ncbi:MULTISPECIES: nitrate/nitrite transporter [Deinococcus]|jgi:NNP family nitrate/nitrite transporter-like MFS transporter|uniref:NNP family nitrate/nitrite transporter-like MFS transporter n=2 Tax=Deinococcus soli (ex Cha et al. 2016) TaxID=1309411 RepID=A0ACC6KEP1_9DEIO|nr:MULTISPECIES: MFS transporter [Deinococcus]MDK2011985.1 MFS transporter [Deinococcus sp. 43]MDR6217849.1 NNP family nitrate/nitrite transporter-like MFS transporter [Deinococcus soli (ex Cha et al. 2016)]MDR6328099.1 NNP family nitrate/nitrite transporter-like MFS transporter [Deinococcus soli (ex Cha et al. 2016)]MDR6750951.1 NNP family nitrate/nitrite transporter-like MFS transporter [Deinococcus soli (ex Cha et al. 2016)]GGB68095.1 nitrite extrusion protein 1 [Deinococcus soli (ex Cha et
MTVPATPSTAPLTADARRVVTAATLGFTLMFAVWVMFAIVGLPIRKELGLTDAQFTLLTAIPVLTGSLLRLPAGIWADRYGGKRVFLITTVITAAFALALAWADGYTTLLALALGVGLAGVSFAVGNAWIAQWVPVSRQGLALGTFGAGNAGASITKLLAPLMITLVPAGLLIPGGWHFVPFVFGLALLVCAALTARLTPNDQAQATGRTLGDWLRPLTRAQVWRFGLYYVVFFGAYVAYSLYLPKYYVDHYGVPLAQAGLLTALFIFPASLLRPLGGYLSDRFGPRTVTVAAFTIMLAGLLPLLRDLPVTPFMLLTTIVGIGMGVGKASTYTLVAQWNPGQMGVVGGLVGLLGGLGGFILPLAFAALKPTLGGQTAFVTLFALTALSTVIFVANMVRLKVLGRVPDFA